MLEAIIIVLAVALDQVTKVLAANLLPALPGGTYPLWEGVFHMTYVENRGAAFGMLQGQMWLFFVITLFACGAILYCLIRYRKRLHRLLRVCLSLIVAGALGNLIDRVLLGYVRDMLDFRLINFAVFNVADSAVCIGAVLLVLDLLFFKKGRALANEIEKAFDKKKAQPAKRKQVAAEPEKTEENAVVSELSEPEGEDPIDP